MYLQCLRAVRKKKGSDAQILLVGTVYFYAEMEKSNYFSKRNKKTTNFSAKKGEQVVTIGSNYIYQ